MNKSILGYNLSECKEMFDLSNHDLSLKIIAFGPKIETINSDSVVQKQHEDEIPFDNNAFDLALMLYDPSQNNDHNSEAILGLLKSLARVAHEVRVLVWTDSSTMNFLGPLLLALQQANYRIELKPSDSNKAPRPRIILRIWPAECVI